jgi:Ca2+-transporting ATPase
LRLGVLRNPWLLTGLSLSVALQALVLWWTPMNTLFHTVPLAPAALWPLAAVASLVLWTEEGRKLLARRQQAHPPESLGSHATSA